MNTYIINICVDTKTTDIYDKVAVTKFPLLITCEDENRLKEILASDHTKNYVKNLISKQLYQTAQYCCVKIDKDMNYSESSKIRYDLKSITNIDY